MGCFGNSQRVIKSLSDIAGEQEQIHLEEQLVYYNHELIEVSKEILKQYKIRKELLIKISEINQKLGKI